MNHATLNIVEMWFWLIAAVVVYAAARRRDRKTRRLALLAACLLITFGLSDMVESTTGAWWRPWWLLVWKGVCVVGLVAVAWVAWRHVTKRRERSEE